MKLLRLLVRATGCVLLGLAIVGIVFYVRFLKSGPELEPWHEVRLTEEFTAERAPGITSLAEYRQLEDHLFAELQTEILDRAEPTHHEAFNRFHAGSRSDPAVWPVNWNRTFELGPEQASGAVLLLHGLTDSPYSLRSVGEHLAGRGYLVVGLRLPGHGTAPSGLRTFEVEDMQAAVRLAMRDLRERMGEHRPIYLVGYSNGAALAVDYALAAIDDRMLTRPAGLVLISPAIAVSKLAIVGLVRTGLSSVPGFGRAAWQLIEMEIDPYKYSSFSLHAAGETHRLTTRVARGVRQRANGGAIGGFPPLLAFISTVDSTVRAEATVDALLEHLAPPGHELVLFDVNRLTAAGQLLVRDPGPLTQRLRTAPNRPYALTVITNASPDTPQVKELRAASGSDRFEERLLDAAWPRTVFSLSHVALPFPPDDPLYGDVPIENSTHVQLGRLELRGENGVLTVPGWMLTRQRSNPFHAYLLERIDEFMLRGAAP